MPDAPLTDASMSGVPMSDTRPSAPARLSPPHGLRRRQVLGGMAALALAAPARAQPSQVVDGPTVMETGTADYQVTSFRQPGPAGSPNHVIRLAWPRGPAPSGGYPAVHLLDGRAAAMVLDAPMLAELAAAGGPAIVTHEYDTDTRFATLERTRDYTPPDAAGRPLDDPRGRPGGQVDAYLDLLTGHILPRAETLAPLAPGRRLLWGHSYGGLCVLQAALVRRSGFARFTAASPALWWDNGAFLDLLMTRAAAPMTDAPVLDIHAGTAEGGPSRRSDDPAAQAMIRMREALPADALARLRTALRAAGVTGQDRDFDGAGHGQSFGQSLRITLAIATSGM